MNLDIWIDLVCPWSYLGKRHLDLALQNQHILRSIEVRWRSFELRPDHHRDQRERLAEAMNDQYRMNPQQIEDAFTRIRVHGAAVGLTLRPEQVRPVNSFDAHRLIHYATGHGRAADVVEGLFSAYHTDLLNIADADILIAIGAQAGLDAREVSRMLASDTYATLVRADEYAAQQGGIAGVPSIRYGGRILSSGLLTADELLVALSS